VSDQPGSPQLESWYWRLLVVYPAGHRAVYADDMINVLMAGALPGQTRPQARTVLDLLKGAAQAWGFRLLARLGGWQRTSAPPALALLALLILCPRSVVAAVRLQGDVQFTPYTGWLAVVVMLPELIWLPVAVAAVLGLRRSALWAAWTAGVLWPLLNTVCGVSGWAPSFLSDFGALVWLPVALMAAAGVGVDDSVRKGFRALGRTDATLAIVGVLIAGVSMAAVRDGQPSAPNAVLLAVHAFGIALVVLACARAVLRPGRFTETVLAVVLSPGLIAGAYALVDHYQWYRREQMYLTLPLALLMGSVIVSRSIRTPVRSGARNT
jgi:hypothetical protein